MKIRTILFGVVLMAVGLFTLINWDTFSRPTRLSVIFGEVQAPLGLLMVGVVAFLSVVYLFFLARAEALALREFRKLSRELEKARKLADESEGSRFEELREFLTTELGEIRRAMGHVTKGPPIGKWQESDEGSEPVDTAHPSG